MIEVNLLPNAHNPRGLSLDVEAISGRVREVVSDKYLLSAIVIVTLAIGTTLTAYFSQTTRAAELEARASAASVDSAQFTQVLVARTRAQASRDSVYQQLAIIRSIDNMRYTWAHLLEEINIALPAYTWLTTVTQTSSATTAAARDTTKQKSKGTPKSPKLLTAHLRARADSLFSGTALPTRFRIIGHTVDIQALTLFMKNLEASPFIKSVQLARSDLVMSNGKEVTEFQLEAESEAPTMSVIQTVPLAIAVK